MRRNAMRTPPGWAIGVVVSSPCCLLVAPTADLFTALLLATALIVGSASLTVVYWRAKIRRHTEELHRQPYGEIYRDAVRQRTTPVPADNNLTGTAATH